MSFDVPIMSSLHFEYDLLFCVFNDGVFYETWHFSLVWFGSFGSLQSVVVLMAGLAISFCHKVLCFLARVFGFLVL